MPVEVGHVPVYTPPPNSQQISLERRSPVLAPPAPRQPRPVRDAAHAPKRGGEVRGRGQVQEGARGAERDWAGSTRELAFERRTGRPRLQWTTAQDGPLKGTPREAIPQCAATAPPKTSRVPPATACSSSPTRV